MNRDQIRGYELLELREDKIKGLQKQILKKNNCISLEKFMKGLLIDRAYWGLKTKGWFESMFKNFLNFMDHSYWFSQNMPFSLTI